LQEQLQAQARRGLPDPTTLGSVSRSKEPVSTQEQVDGVLSEAKPADAAALEESASPRMPTGEFVRKLAGEAFIELSRHLP
jgi:hypothetical protein